MDTLEIHSSGCNCEERKGFVCCKVNGVIKCYRQDSDGNHMIIACILDVV